MSTIVNYGSAQTYTSLTAFVAAFAAGGWIGEGVNDSPLNETVTVNGTTSATDFGIIRTAAGQSLMDNHANALAFDTSKGVNVTNTTGYANVFYITSEWWTIQKLQIQQDAAGNQEAINVFVNVGNCNIDRCLVFCTANTFPNQLFLSSAGYSHPNVFSNLVCLSNTNIFGGHPGVNLGIAPATVYVNCTFLQASDFIGTNTNTVFLDPYGVAASTIINCVGMGFNGGWCNTTNCTGSNNATDASSFGGMTSTSSLTSLTYADQFVGTLSTGLNAKLKTGSALIDAGADATAYMPGGLAIDIFGTARPQGSAWDIGAYEFPASGALLVHPSMTGGMNQDFTGGMAA